MHYSNFPPSDTPYINWDKPFSHDDSELWKFKVNISEGHEVEENCKQKGNRMFHTQSASYFISSILNNQMQNIKFVT